MHDTVPVQIRKSAKDLFSELRRMEGSLSMIQCHQHYVLIIINGIGIISCLYLEYELFAFLDGAVICEAVRVAVRHEDDPLVLSPHAIKMRAEILERHSISLENPR